MSDDPDDDFSSDTDFLSQSEDEEGSSDGNLRDYSKSFSCPSGESLHPDELSALIQDVFGADHEASEEFKRRTEEVFGQAVLAVTSRLAEENNELAEENEMMEELNEGLILRVLRLEE